MLQGTNVWALVVFVVGCGAGAREATTVTLAPSVADAGHLEVADSGKVEEPVVEAAPQRSVPGVALFRCDVIHGRVFTCSGWAEGQAVLEQDGLFWSCSIAAGRKIGCTTWASGVVPIFDGGVYRTCRLDHGRVMSCAGPFDGPAVLERGPGGR